MTPDIALQRSTSVLRYAFGLVLILIGLDKVLRTYFIVNWEGYVSDLARAVLPISPPTLVLMLGIAEIIVGIMMLTRWARIAAIIAIVTLAAIVVNLLSMGLYDIAARDVLLALSLLVLIWLIDARAVMQTKPDTIPL